MYSDYGAVGGIEFQMLTNLRELQRIQQAKWMTSDWLRVLPTSRSQLTGDWGSSTTELQKWRPAPVVTETARRHPLNLDVVADEGVKSSLHCDPRRRRDDGKGSTDADRPAKRRARVANGRRFDFTRLAESATRRDDSSTTDSDTEITRTSNGDNGRVKVVKYDDDQSDRRLSLKPAAAAAVQDADRPSLTLHSSTLQPLKSVFNPTESLDRYRRHCLMIR